MFAILLTIRYDIRFLVLFPILFSILFSIFYYTVRYFVLYSVLFSILFAITIRMLFLNIGPAMEEERHTGPMTGLLLNDYYFPERHRKS